MHGAVKETEMPEWIVFAALQIGWVVMFCGGVFIAGAVFWFAVDRWHRLLKNMVLLGHFKEAIAEWQANHPDKYKEWRKENGLDA